MSNGIFGLVSWRDSSTDYVEFKSCLEQAQNLASKSKDGWTEESHLCQLYDLIALKYQR